GAADRQIFEKKEKKRTSSSSMGEELAHKGRSLRRRRKKERLRGEKNSCSSFRHRGFHLSPAPNVGPESVSVPGKEDIGYCEWWLYEQVKQSEIETASFSAVKRKDEEGKKHDYYVNTGYAIRTLREEFPELFYRELSFDIYSLGDNHESLMGIMKRRPGMM
ncbi:transcription factor tau 91 kDa subunit, partial [Striga asiatica]